MPFHGTQKRAAVQTHSSSQKGFMKSRGQAVDAQTETAVGRAAVLEELQIELDVLGQTLLLSLLLQHLVAMLALGTGVISTPRQIRS